MKFLVSIGIYFFLIQYGFTQSTPQYYEGLAIDKKLVKNSYYYGFKNVKGKNVIPCIYDSVVRPFRDGLACVIKNGKAGLINTRGKTVVDFQFKEIALPEKNILPVKNEKGLWGFYDLSSEKIIIDFAYDNFKFAPKNRVILQKNGKWGMMYLNGKQILDFQYRDITHIAHKHYRYIRLNRWQVKDLNGKVLFEVSFDSLSYLGNDLYKFCMRGMYGITDPSGKILFNGEFQKIESNKYGLILAQKTDGWGVISIDGKTVVPFKYDLIKVDSLCIRVMLNQKWGLYGHDGRELASPKYVRINAASDGVMLAEEEGEWFGYLGMNGFNKISFIYKYAEDFHEGVALVKRRLPNAQNETRALIDLNGEYVISPDDFPLYEKGILEFQDGRKIVRFNYLPYSNVKPLGNDYYACKSGAYYGVMNVKGDTILNFAYDSVGSYSEGYFVVYKNKKVAVVDTKRTVHIPFTSKYQRIFTFHEGMARMMINNRYGFIDHFGNVWISPQYQYTGEFSNGLVKVMIKNKWAFLDKDEKLIVQPYYDEATTFKNGISIVQANGLYNIINTEGKELHAEWYESITPTPFGKFLLRKGEFYALADKNGRELLPPRYLLIEELSNGWYIVNKEGFWGLLDQKTDLLIPYVHEGLEVYPEKKIVITGSKGHTEDVRLE